MPDKDGFVEMPDKDDVVEINFNSDGSDKVLQYDTVPNIERFRAPISHSFWSEVKPQLILAFPVLCTFFLRKSVDIISVMFVGRLGALYLSAAGIATVTANVTGFSMIVGLAGPVSTICSQAYGLKDTKALGLALQKAILILIGFVCIPVSLLWLVSRPIMLALGQTTIIATAASRYLLLMIPCLWALSITFSIQNWLHAQSKTRAVLFITFIVTGLHPLWCYLFIYVIGMGYLGAALAVSSSKIIEVVLLLGYIHFKALDHDIHLCCTSESFKDWWPFLRLGLPNMVMMMEWWASEIIIFMAGTLANPSTQVSAMSIYQSTLSICFMVPSSFQVSASTRVGNALGANDPLAASLAATVAPILASASTILLSIVLFCVRDRWGYVFTSDQKVVYIVNSIMPVVMVYIVADGIQSALTGVLKGLGKQRIGGPIVVFAYYAIGLPISYYLAFRRHYGVIGLCVGTTIGTGVHMLLYFLVVLRTNWIKEAAVVQERQQRVVRRHLPAFISSLGYDSGDDDEETWLESVENAVSGVGITSCIRRSLGIPDSNQSNGGGGSGRGSIASSLYRRLAAAVGVKVGPTEYELVQHYTDSLVASGDDDLIIL